MPRRDDIETPPVLDSARGRWLLAGLYALFIFGLSSLSMPPVLGPMALNDKAKHFALYGVFAYLVVRALAPRMAGRPVRLIMATVALVSLYGASDEFHQSFVPGRSAEVADWLVDSLAALVVSGFYALRIRL